MLTGPEELLPVFASFVAVAAAEFVTVPQVSAVVGDAI